MPRSIQVAVTLKLVVDIPDSDISNTEQNFIALGYTVTKKRQKSGNWSLAAVR